MCSLEDVHYGEILKAYNLTLAGDTRKAKTLLGLEGAFSYSTVLSNMMTSHIRKQFPDTLATIMPPAWG
ncbi:hypothetical protein [Yersinia pekkanenii]|uniref:hypothetical protein n=1 Tax=Yersinia pekkanenii TaxID=1288385 RepID=UPI0012E0BC30